MTPSRRTVRVASGLALVCMLVVAHTGVGVVSSARQARGAVRRSGALEVARRLYAELRGRDPRERDAVRGEAIEAFRAARVAHAGEPRSEAEAAFRAGELLRAAARSAEARQEFLHAHVAGGTEFRPRAALELGHSYRRAGHHARALDWYETAREDRLATRKQRDNADLWRGKVHLRAGREGEAARIWEALARSSPDVLTVLSAHEHIVCLLLAAGRVNDARAVARRCSRALRCEVDTGEHVRERVARRVAELVRKTLNVPRETLDLTPR